MTNIERYDIRDEKNLLIALDKSFERTNNTSEEMALNKDKQYDRNYDKVVDISHVMMIEAQTERSKRILSRYVNSDANLNYPTLDFKEPGNTIVSNDYLIRAVNILNIDNDKTKFIVGKDKPIILETEDFKILIAPKIEED